MNSDTISSAHPGTHVSMLADGRARTDRLLGNLLLAHFPVALMLAPMRGTWLSAFLIGLSVSLASFFLARTRPAEAVTRLVIAAALMVYSALFIHQSGGMVELHFHIFSSLAFLLAYRDWRPIVLAAAVIAVHHLLFMVLQASGAGVHAFPDGHGSLGIVVVHALFVVMETSVLVWLSRRLEDEALEVEQLHIVARALAAGNVDVDVKGGATADAYRRVIATVRLLVSEASGVADAMKRNDFTRRGDASKFDGSFRGVIEDLNASVDSLQQSRGAMERQRDDVLRFLSGLRRAVDGLARREMTVRLEGSFEGDQHAAQHAFNDAIAHLESTLADASALSANCREASQEIAEGSATLARGANEQASSVEEASASLQQLSSMSISTAQHAAAGRRLAEETRASAASGVEAMQALNEAVARIKSSADQTAKIVRTIDEIAFQTNLLALNAAVEAARAGDAGRGFAVVAVEVRELAMRSAEAARSSTDMIAESVKTAARGTELSEKVAARLAEIDSQVGKVRDVINDIASSNEQQATGVSQIATAMEHVGRITQEASANAEHSQSIAGTLATESERMAALLSEFDVRGGAIGDGTKRQPLGTGRTKEPQRKVSVGRPRIHAG